MARLETLQHNLVPSVFNIINISDVDCSFNISKHTFSTPKTNKIEQTTETIDETNGIKNLLFIDTGFYPTDTPVATLGVMESERWITLPVNLMYQTSIEKYQYIQVIIQENYLAHPRGLPLWGDIQRYCYYQILADKKIEKIWFDVTGNVIDLYKKY